MAVITTNIVCELSQPVNVTFLHGNIFSLDNGGNVITVDVLDNGEPATIGGTVSANVIRSDGGTVAVTGALSGNQCSVTLPQAAYAVPGIVQIIIKLTQSSTVTTIAAVVANVYQSSTDTSIDPGQVITDINALIASINTAVNSIPANYSSLLHDIASDYSSSSTYAVGDYAWYSGALKRCIVAITTAESYTSAHWTDAVLGDDVSDLKSAIDVSATLSNTEATQISATEENPVDYDDYKIPGNYYAGSSSAVSHITHKPNGLTAAHRLFVMPTTQNNRVVQIIIANAASGNIYTRYYSGSWSEWVRILTGDDQPLTIKAGKATTIASGQNINLYITPGNYKVTSSSSAQGIIGLPMAVGGRLTVMTLSAENIIFQIYIRQDNTSEIFVRYGRCEYVAQPEGTVWAEWHKMISDVHLNTVLNNNYKNYYNLPQNDFVVGGFKTNGTYDSSMDYRICTPDIHVAPTDISVRPSSGSLAVMVYPYTDGVYDGSYITADPKGTIIKAGQQYKLCLRRVPTSDHTAMTVLGQYQNIWLFNPIQMIDRIGMTGCAEYVDADYGLVPCGVFYPGISGESYDDFTFNTLTSDVYAAFETLRAANGEYISRTDLGACSDGVQHLYLYDFNPVQIDSFAREPIPTIFIICGQHGYEKASVYALYYMFKHMIANPNDNPLLDYLRNHIRIMVVPVANPYGFDQKIYKNYNGVNLNRNWETDGWGEGEGEQDPDSKDYAGAEPFSEPETQAMRDAFLGNKAIICTSVDFHTNGANVAVSAISEVNNILYANLYNQARNQFKKAVRYHVKNITSHFNGQYSLGLDDDELCATVATASHHGGTANRWMTGQDKVSCTFETFPGFPGGQTYTPEVIRASEELIVNYLVTLCNYIKNV